MTDLTVSLSWLKDEVYQARWPFGNGSSAPLGTLRCYLTSLWRISELFHNHTFDSDLLANREAQKSWRALQKALSLANHQRRLQSLSRTLFQWIYSCQSKLLVLKLGRWNHGIALVVIILPSHVKEQAQKRLPR